jgi:hypothetical protein
MSPPSTASAGGAATATATAGTAGSAAVSTYALEGGSNLAPHVGHRISITGTLAPMSGAAGAAAGAAASGARPNPRLQVASMQMISTDCPAK